MWKVFLSVMNYCCHCCSGGYCSSHQFQPHPVFFFMPFYLSALTDFIFKTLHLEASPSLVLFVFLFFWSPHFFPCLKKKNIADMSRQIIQVSEMFGNYIIQFIIHTSFFFFPPTGRRRCIVLQRFKHSDEN